MSLVSPHSQPTLTRGLPFGGGSGPPGVHAGGGPGGSLGPQDGRGPSGSGGLLDFGGFTGAALADASGVAFRSVPASFGAPGRGGIVLGDQQHSMGQLVVG